MKHTCEMDMRFRPIINELLSTQLLKEILTELVKYDTWKSNLLRGVIKSKQPNPVNREQLELFAKSEKQRLDSAAVYLQYTVLNPTSQTSALEPPFAGAQITSAVDIELHKLSEWVIKRNELRDRFQSFLTKSKAKVPIHKQDHDPVQHCPNPRCKNIALFRHTPDSLVCVSCGMKQTFLDNNIAYGEEQIWAGGGGAGGASGSAGAGRDMKEDEPAKVKQLLVTPHLLKQFPKKFDLAQIFHYNVETPNSLVVAQAMLTKDMLHHIATNEPFQKLRKQWSTKPSAAIVTEAARLWKQHLKQIQFTHTPGFIFTCTCVLLDWSPPPISSELHTELSQTLYLFDTALQEYQQLHPNDSKQIHKIRSANFRKYVLLQLIRLKKEAEHLRYFITLSKHDKLNRLYDLAFQLICHYVDEQR